MSPAQESWRSLLRKMVDLETNYFDGVEDSEQPTDEPVVVVLQLLLGVPAVAIVSVSHVEVLGVGAQKLRPSLSAAR